MITHRVFRSLLSIFILSAVLCSGLANGSELTATQVVNIPDPGLQGAIRAALNKPVGVLTVADMENLTTLDASRSSRGNAPVILSLEGLQSARNLLVLNLTGDFAAPVPPGFPGERSNAVALATSDLSTLSALTKLQSLLLSENGLTNLILPIGLTNLQTLTLFYNALTDSSFLSSLSSLRSLDLSFNQFGNLTELTGLTNLERLALGANQLTNFSFLSRLTSLHSLDLSQNHVAELALPAGLTSLRELRLSSMGLVSLTLPQDLTNLQTLDLALNQLTNGPQGLTNLTDLNLAANRITDLTLLRDAPQLQKLNLSGSGLTNRSDLSEYLSGLHHLRELDLGYNELSTFALPQELTSLEMLSLAGAQLTNITFLSDLARLRSLDLGDNKLRSVAFPASLAALEYLNLAGNQLKNLSLPANLKTLERLNLSYNQFTDFAFLEGFSRLQVLDLYNDYLTKVTLPPGLTILKELGLRIGVLDPSDCTFGKCIVITNPYTEVSLPASIDLSQLTIYGFRKSDVTVLGLWLRAPILLNDGRLSIRVNGARGRTVQAQRSTNVVNWESWQSVVLGDNGGELTDDTLSAPYRFFRVVADQ